MLALINFALFVSMGALCLGTLELKTLTDSQAVCNDGTPAGYYISKGSDPAAFVIYLQGGGFCFDNSSCESRWGKGTPRLMSSKNWATSMTGEGLLSSNATQNPYWHAATIVFVPYCSSDSWSGSYTPKSGGLHWYFHGSHIVDAVIEDLLANQGLSVTEHVLFTGSSAGAEGLLAHADRVPKQIRNANPKANVTVLIDSGWFIDSFPYKQGNCENVARCTEYEAMRRAFLIWEPVVNEGCEKAMPKDMLYQCMLGPHVYPFIQTPAFVFQFRFDGAQMGHDGIYSKPSSGAELSYAQQSAANLTLSFHTQGAKGVFSPACYYHTITHSPGFATTLINGKSLAQVFNDWRMGKDTKFYIDVCNTPGCNPTCP